MLPGCYLLALIRYMDKTRDFVQEIKISLLPKILKLMVGLHLKT